MSKLTASRGEIMRSSKSSLGTLKPPEYVHHLALHHGDLLAQPRHEEISSDTLLDQLGVAGMKVSKRRTRSFFKGQCSRRSAEGSRHFRASSRYGQFPE